MPKPPRLTKAEIERRERRIAEQWKEEQEQPLTPRDMGAVISSLVRTATEKWDQSYWRYADAYTCMLETVREYRLLVPQSVWDALSAWSLLDVAGAIRR